MSDWKTLERARVTASSAGVPAQFCSTSADGFNGCFCLVLKGAKVKCIASDAAEHHGRPEMIWE